MAIVDLPTRDVRRANDRFHTDLGWLDSRHSFSFGHHRDPSNTSHGLLLVSNDDRVDAGRGFGTHGHRDMEIVTWVLSGALEHRDSHGNHGVLHPGLAQRMSAGTGIQHSEMNASETEPVRFVQMWVVPDQTGYTPGYEQRDMSDALGTGELVPVVSGQGHDGAVAINQPDAVMWVARLEPGASVDLPDAPFVHIFVARGSAVLGDEHLAEGDACRLTDAGTLALRASDASEIIVWESGSEVTR